MPGSPSAANRLRILDCPQGSATDDPNSSGSGGAHLEHTASQANRYRSPLDRRAWLPRGAGGTLSVCETFCKNRGRAEFAQRNRHARNDGTSATTDTERTSGRLSRTGIGLRDVVVSLVGRSSKSPSLVRSALIRDHQKPLRDACGRQAPFRQTPFGTPRTGSARGQVRLPGDGPIADGVGDTGPAEKKFGNDDLPPSRCEDGGVDLHQLVTLFQ
jgi:hypothetical protein